MKTLNRRMKLIGIVLVAAVLATAWTIWGTQRTEAVIAIIKTTGMFSLTQGQATSAHVVNTWAGHDRQFVIDWTVLDGSGNVLARSYEQTLLPGQSADFEYGTGVYEPIPGNQRATIRLVLRVQGASRNRNAGTPGPDDFIATQEVFNTGDGKTTVFLPYVEQ